jgi:hypothetical protein
LTVILAVVPPGPVALAAHDDPLPADQSFPKQSRQREGDP